ncbi:hypothetical protein HUJ04_001681 [Dendroctonus ponderosae]|nr:hypothetical protein HUJ04_001681 [Dendroctonus ponderosae]
MATSVPMNDDVDDVTKLARSLSLAARYCERERERRLSLSRSELASELTLAGEQPGTGSSG